MYISSNKHKRHLAADSFFLQSLKKIHWVLKSRKLGKLTIMTAIEHASAISTKQLQHAHKRTKSCLQFCDHFVRHTKAFLGEDICMELREYAQQGMQVHQESVQTSSE